MFQRRLAQVVLAAIGTGCGTAPTTTSKSGLDVVACSELPLAGAPGAYVEIRSFDGRDTVSRGTRCEGAVDRAKCEADYAAITGGEHLVHLFGQQGQMPAREIVIATDANGVKVFRTPDEVRAWLVPVDSAADAVAIAELAGYNVTCNDSSSSGVRKTARGFEVLATRMTKDCTPVETTQFVLAIDGAGAVKIIREAVLSSSPNVCVGRRPEGLASAAPSATENAIGRWLAQVAYLEAASVDSFERLASELVTFGAPAELALAARRASADEARHAAAMTALASRYGAVVTPPARLAFPARSFEAFAEENAVEGCIFETFGACVGLAQAATARDPEVRRVMKHIAADESRHAELAWQVDAWARTHLTPSALARIDAARARAAASLLEPEASSLDAVSAAELGLVPRRPLAEAFVAQFVA